MQMRPGWRACCLGSLQLSDEIKVGGVGIIPAAPCRKCRKWGGHLNGGFLWERGVVIMKGVWPTAEWISTGWGGGSCQANAGQGAQVAGGGWCWQGMNGPQ